MRPPKERQQVVLAEAVEFDIANENHILVGLFEHGVADNIGDLIA